MTKKKYPPGLLISLLVWVVCLTQFGYTLYSPSLPAVADYFGVSADIIQWSMSSYMLGSTVSKLFFGPISEGIGRKKALIISLFMMLCGSISCVVPLNVAWLVGAKFIQGLGAGGCACLWRPILRDAYHKEEFASYYAYLDSFVALIVPLAPLLGGYLQIYIGWQGGFLFLAAYCLVLGFCTYRLLPETHRAPNPSNLKLGHVLAEYKKLCMNRVFVGVCVCAALTFGGIFSWFVVGPVFVIKVLGRSPVEYGWLSALVSLLPFFSAQINARAVRKYGIYAMIRLGWGVCLGAGMLLIAGYGFFGLTVWSLMPGIFLVFFGGAFVWPNIAAVAFSPFGHAAGYAGALYGVTQSAAGAFFFGLMAWLPETNQLIYALVVTILFSLAWVVYEFLVVPKGRGRRPKS